MNRNQKIFTVILAIVVVFVFITLVFFTIAKGNQNSTSSTTKNTVIIDNQNSYNSGIQSSVFTNIANAAYTETSLNIHNPQSVYHGIIRAGSFKSNTLGVSFILDIPSLKISWAVGQNIDTSGNPLSDASALCVTKPQSIYSPLVNCEDVNSGFTTPAQKQLLKISEILPLSGPTYLVDFNDSVSEQNTAALVITYYTSTGQEDALTALQSLGYNPSNYQITYIDGTQ
jgi:hypothetical protein